MFNDFATSTIALLNQDTFVMYLYAPIVGLCIFVFFRLLSAVFFKP